MSHRCEVSLLRVLLPTQNMNTQVSVCLCAILFDVNSLMSVNLGCPSFDYHSASRSDGKAS